MSGLGEPDRRSALGAPDRPRPGAPASVHRTWRRGDRQRRHVERPAGVAYARRSAPARAAPSRPLRASNRRGATRLAAREGRSRGPGARAGGDGGGGRAAHGGWGAARGSVGGPRCAARGRDRRRRRRRRAGGGLRQRSRRPTREVTRRRRRAPPAAPPPLHSRTGGPSRMASPPGSDALATPGSAPRAPDVPRIVTPNGRAPPEEDRGSVSDDDPRGA